MVPTQKFSRTFQDEISNPPKFKDLPGHYRTKFKFQDIPGTVASCGYIKKNKKTAGFVSYGTKKGY